MVDHNQKGIEAGGKGKVSDEVARDLLERVGCGGANGGEQGNGRMGIALVLLADCAALNIFTDIGGQARPPKLGHNKLASFQVARVAGSFMVMTTLEDGVAEGVIVGDIDAASVG